VNESKLAFHQTRTDHPVSSRPLRFESYDRRYCNRSSLPHFCHFASSCPGTSCHALSRCPK
jgi:hypothetical protein